MLNGGLQIQSYMLDACNGDVAVDRFSFSALSFA